MGLFPKEYLRFADVAEYLNQIFDFKYDISNREIFFRLQNDIEDLVKEKNLRLVYYYSGEVNISHTKYIMNGDHWEDVESEKKYKDVFNGYVYVYSTDKMKFFDEYPDDYVQLNKSLDIVHKRTREENEDFYYSASDSVYISFNDLYYIKSDLDKIFNQPNINDVKEQEVVVLKQELEAKEQRLATSRILFKEKQSEIQQLKVELEQANTQIINLLNNEATKAGKNLVSIGKTKNKELSTRIRELEQQLAKQSEQVITPANDELSEKSKKSYLVTIGLLNELLTTPKIEGGKATYPSNAQIIEKITPQKLYGQGKSTLETRFSEASKALKESRKN